MKPSGRRGDLCLLSLVLIAVVALGLAAPAVSAARVCRPHGHVLARRGGVVLWSARHRAGGHVRVRVSVCAPATGRAELVTSGGRGLAPSVADLRVAGHFVAFFLTTGSAEDVDFMVFDLARGRVKLADFDGCSGTRECALSTFPTIGQFVLAPNGWVAEVWSISSCDECGSTATGGVALVATNARGHHYGIDFGANISTLTLVGDTVGWTSDLGGASSVVLGPGVVPPASAQPLSPCQLLTSEDVAPVLGASSTAASPGQCKYTSTANPEMTLTLGLETGLSAAQVSGDESALQSAGWDSSLNIAQQTPTSYQSSTTSAGVTHQQLRAFENGAELSLDLTMPSTSAPEQLAWLTDVAFERLYGVPVQRAQ